jgi:DNA-binding PadR family transcriptional regulator
MAAKTEKDLETYTDPVVSRAAPFEFLVLMSVRHLDGKAYGAEIWRNVSYRLGREPSIGQIYVALKRLEDKDCVKSFVAPPTPEKGGRSKRVYEVTQKGMRVLEESAASFTALGSISKEFDSENFPQGTSVAR